MNDCIFCKIVNNQVANYKIYEDENTYVFLDIAKDVDGHMLVVPKTHYNNISDVSNEAISQIMNTIKKVTNHLIENCNYQGVNILNASGTVAGQSVQHLHFHLIPRRKDDGIDAWPTFTGSKKELSQLHKDLMIK